MNQNTSSGMTTKRCGFNTKIFWNGTHAGETFKFTAAPGFGLRLNGVYWRRGEATTKGGATVNGYRLQRDALDAARAYLSKREAA